MGGGLSVGIPEDIRDRGGAVGLTGGEKVIPRALLTEA